MGFEYSAYKVSKPHTSTLVGDARAVGNDENKTKTLINSMKNSFGVWTDTLNESEIYFTITQTSRRNGESTTRNIGAHFCKLDHR